MIVVLVSSFIIVYHIRKWRKRKQEELLAVLREKQKEQKMLREKYERIISEQEHAKKELAKIQESTYETLLNEKEKEIQHRQSEIEKLEQLLHARANVNEKMRSTDIYKAFRHYVSHPLDNYSNKEKKQLIEMVEQNLPSFYAIMHGGKSITQEDYFICILIRLQFAQVEISGLTGVASSNLTRKRQQLLRRCFNEQGSAEDFNEKLMSIT